jgi:hypothetical protein
MKTTLVLIAIGTMSSAPVLACEAHETHASGPVDQVAMTEQQPASTVSDQQRADQWKILQEQVAPSGDSANK